MKKYFLFTLLFVCLVISSCAKKQTVVSDEDVSMEQTSDIYEPMDPENFSQEPSIRGTETGTVSDLETVYFSFDSSKISDDALEILKKNTKYLEKNPMVNVVVEGHCDERGTIEYNLALGQKRAVKVKEYYVQLGIDSNRIATISYGEEMPQDTRHNEAGWAKNRRAETKIIK